MQYILQLILFLLVVTQVKGQQLPSWSSYYETGFVWNPALTAKWNSAETSVVHRQDWIGFDDAPVYSNLSFQIPLVSGYDTKAAIGAFVERDKVGPQEKLGGAITYNYRFRPQLFGKKDDVLGLGMLVNIAQYRWDISGTTVYDPSRLTIDPTVASNIVHPNAGIGAFYISVSDFYAYQKSHYYVGMSINQLLQSPIAQFRGKGDNTQLLTILASRHATLHTGYRHIPFRRPYFIEPSIMLMYGGGRTIQAMAHVRYELIDAFWGAAGVATTGEAFAQVGVILDDDSFVKGIVKDGALRMGIKASWQVGPVGLLARPGVEFYGAYIFVVE